MTFPLQHKLLTVGGALFGSAERWSMGIRFANGFDTSTGIDQADVDACVAPIRAWFTSTSSAFPTVHTVDMIKLAPIGVDGKYPGTLDAKEATIGAAINGAGTSASLPAQCSLVISLTTPFSRGRAHIGRVYPPPVSVGFTQGAAGRLSTAGVQAYMGTFRTMLNAIRANTALNAPAVMSRIGTGVSIGITGLRCGEVIDTQRRRRTSIPENYSSIAL